MSHDYLRSTSIAMSYILRHGAAKEGIPIDDGGWVWLSDLQKFGKLRHLTDKLLSQILERDSPPQGKGRFSGEQIGESWRVRATQGHSITSVKEEKLLTVVDSAEPFPLVTHGTFYKAWNGIKSRGLDKMGRNHIHLAPGHPGDEGVYSARVKTAEIIIEIDLDRAIKHGIPFYISDNRVILTLDRYRQVSLVEFTISRLVRTC